MLGSTIVDTAPLALSLREAQDCLVGESAEKLQPPPAVGPKGEDGTQGHQGVGAFLAGKAGGGVGSGPGHVTQLPPRVATWRTRE